MSAIRDRVRNLLARPVDGASLAMFRVFYGLVIAWEAVRYLWPKPGGSKVYQLFIAPAWNFPYHGFEWVRPWPEPFMTLHFILLGIAGLLLAAGLFYRAAAVTVAISLTYIFLLEEAIYLNHMYLMCLLAGLLCVMPAQRCWSLDGWRRRNDTVTRCRGDEVKRGAETPLTGAPGQCVTLSSGPTSIPFWPVFLLRAQLFIVYFYGGIAKFDGDWLTGSPMASIATKTMNLLATVLSEGQVQAIASVLDKATLAQMIALGGLGFDLSIGFLLLIRRTRILALGLCLFFHAFNNQMFSIGVFPVLAFTGTLIFCEPDWPRRFGRWVRRPRLARPNFKWLIAGGTALPIAGALLGWKLRTAPTAAPAGPLRLPRWVLAFVCAWLTFHTLWPLRHYAIAGNAVWTEEGHRFSWRMMLRSKTGFIQFGVVDPGLLTCDATGQPQIVWEEWTRRFPKVLHEDVDACAPSWERMPKLLVLFEPLVGERIVYNSAASRHGSADDARRWLEKNWQEAYGRTPKITATVSVTEALGAVRNAVTRADGLADAKPAFLTVLQGAREIAGTPTEDARDAEMKMIALDDALKFLLAHPDFGKLVHTELAKVHPLVMQGRVHGRSAPEFLAIEDPHLQILHNDRWRIDRKQWKHTFVTHLDMRRLSQDARRNLPCVLAYFQDGHPRIEWNHHAELISRQIDTVEQHPYQAHQYAQRIASIWEAEFGRRPEVFVTSLLMLNHRTAQPMIDPRADLASAPIKLFAHNDWILHLPKEGDPPVLQQESVRQIPGAIEPVANVERIGNPSDAAAGDSPVKTVALRQPGGQKLSQSSTQWRDGQKHSTTTVWYEGGQLFMQAHYVNGAQHGPAMCWHPNGRPAVSANYERGRRQGLATCWFENGQKSWQGEFHAGNCHGLARSWHADGRPAEQARFRDGQMAIGSLVLGRHVPSEETPATPVVQTVGAADTLFELRR